MAKLGADGLKVCNMSAVFCADSKRDRYAANGGPLRDVLFIAKMSEMSSSL